MRIKDLGFRELDRHYYFIENLKNVKKIYKKLRIKNDINPILVFSYINHEKGIQFRILGNIVVNDNRLTIENDFLNNEFILSYDHFEDVDIKPIPKKTIMSIDDIDKVNEQTSKYYPDESLINSRELKYLDKYRDLRLIDDVQFLLLTKDGQQEDVWARIESMDEKEIFLCTLLDRTERKFGLKKNDKIYIKYVEHPKYKGLMFVKKVLKK